MSDARPSREQFEESWKRRLDDARQQLDFSRNCVRQVETDIQSGRVSALDGQDAYADALQDEKQAVEKYETVLNIFTNLVLRGVLPEKKDRR